MDVYQIILQDSLLAACLSNPRHRMQEAMLSDLRQPDRRFANQWSNPKADREAGQLFLFLLVAVVGNVFC